MTPQTEGKIAFLSDEPIVANPYEKGTDQRTDWDKGWIDAFKLEFKNARQN